MPIQHLHLLMTQVVHTATDYLSAPAMTLSYAEDDHGQFVCWLQPVDTVAMSVAAPTPKVDTTSTISLSVVTNSYVYLIIRPFLVPAIHQWRNFTCSMS